MVMMPFYFSILTFFFGFLSVTGVQASVVDCRSTVRLDLEENTKMTLYSEPFLSWQTCEANPDLCKNSKKVSWPDRDSCIEPLVDGKDQKIFQEKMVEDYYGKKRLKRYYQVKVRYRRELKPGSNKFDHHESIAWADEEDIAWDGNQDEVSGVDPNSDPDCNGGYSKNQRDELDSLIKQLDGQVVTQASKASKESNPPNSVPDKSEPKVSLSSETGSNVDKASKVLSGLVGKCAVQPPVKSNPGWDLSKTIYDQAVIKKGHLKDLSKDQAEQLSKLTGKNVTRDDLINIDVLARTIYGEMANCYDNGLQYPMAITKVALNREAFIVQNTKSCEANPPADPFGVAETSGDESRPLLSRVLTAKDQFSVWNPIYDQEINHSLEQVLCPPSGATYWKTGANGKQVPTPSFEKKIWDQTLKIATEAVLFPASFQAKSKDIKEHFYTSNINSFMGLTRVSRSVGGKRINNSKCLNLFEAGPRTQVAKNLKSIERTGLCVAN